MALGKRAVKLRFSAAVFPPRWAEFPLGDSRTWIGAAPGTARKAPRGPPGTGSREAVQAEDASASGRVFLSIAASHIQAGTRLGYFAAL